ncbi:MAG: (d)CMP kinase [Flavobacteriales bacterium]|nr:(d)CMP kinase [Flavobacteriales bacterium]
MTERRISIAIDGHSSCGKSTLARDVAQRLGYAHVDSGAMYRAMALALLRDGLTPSELADNESAQREFLARHTLEAKISSEGKVELWLDGKKEEEALRLPEVAAVVSEVSAWPLVRSKMHALQRELAACGGVVMDGRDIGTVVLPEADLKIFLTASLPVRVERRRKELESKGIFLRNEEVEENLKKRDYLDTHRPFDPLRKASDARVLDNSYLTREEQTKEVMKWVQQILGGSF